MGLNLRAIHKSPINNFLTVQAHFPRFPNGQMCTKWTVSWVKATLPPTDLTWTPPMKHRHVYDLNPSLPHYCPITLLPIESTVGDDERRKLSWDCLYCIPFFPGIRTPRFCFVSRNSLRFRGSSTLARHRSYRGITFFGFLLDSDLD